MVYLSKAEIALHEASSVSVSGIHQEVAQILRARVESALKGGRTKTADSALEQLAGLSENSPDKVIDSAYQGAAGARAL